MRLEPVYLLKEKLLGCLLAQQRLQLEWRFQLALLALSLVPYYFVCFLHS
jgi:hypothetical protein